MDRLSTDTNARPLLARPVSQTPRQPPPVLISASLVRSEVREIADSELELIEMRYQQLVALKNIETLFADGQLDSM